MQVPLQAGVREPRIPGGVVHRGLRHPVIVLRLAVIAVYVVRPIPQ